MIFSRSSQYAIQALVVLASEPAGSHVLCRSLADQLDLPLPYLSKLMQEFSRRGIVGSTRGRQGGYYMMRDARDLNLMEIMTVVGGEKATKECFLGFKECSDETACAMHCNWRPVKEKLFELLKEQNLSNLVDAVRKGRCELKGLNVGMLETL
ncbi:MAG: Rrf2 family transcriptional regulator [Pseudomonadota bacterium]